MTRFKIVVLKNEDGKQFQCLIDTELIDHVTLCSINFTQDEDVVYIQEKDEGVITCPDCREYIKQLRNEVSSNFKLKSK